MKFLNKEKKRHIIFCEDVLKKAEREAELESISLVNGFKNQRKHRFRELMQKDDEELFDQYEEKLLEQIDLLEDQLMGVEMKLQDNLAVSTGDFNDRVKKLIDEMKTKTQNQYILFLTFSIKDVGGEVETFYSSLKTYATALQEQFATEYD